MKKSFMVLCLVAACVLSANVSADVFITELADPNNTGSGAARFVELYNNGASSVVFSGSWALRRWTNANAGPQSDVALSGTIPAGGFYIITNKAANFLSDYGFAADQAIGTGGPADSNGDDQISLIDGSGTLIDIFGVPGEDGSGTAHEFEDGRAERVASVVTGVTPWAAIEWDIDNDSGGGAGSQDAPGGFDPGSWIGVPSADTWTLPSTLNFGTADAPTTIASSVTITAISATTIDSVTPTSIGDFSYTGSAPPLPASLAGGATVELFFEYSPTSNTGSVDSATVTINATTGSPSSNDVILSGATLTEVADIAAARAAAPGTFKIAGTIVCSASDIEADSSSRNEFFIDSSGGGGIRFRGNTTTYVPGDSLTGVVGAVSIDTFSGVSLVQIDVSAGDAGAGTPGAPPVPVLIDGVDLASTVDGTFVRMNGITILSQALEDDIFAAGTPGDGAEENMSCIAPDGATFVIRIEDDSPMRFSTMATSNMYTFDVIGLRGHFNPDDQIFPTAVLNFSLLSIDDWDKY